MHLLHLRAVDSVQLRLRVRLRVRVRLRLRVCVRLCVRLRLRLRLHLRLCLRLRLRLQVCSRILGGGVSEAAHDFRDHSDSVAYLLLGHHGRLGLRKRLPLLLRQDESAVRKEKKKNGTNEVRTIKNSSGSS